jgi:hypothetical protein
MAQSLKLLRSASKVLVYFLFLGLLALGLYDILVPDRPQGWWLLSTIVVGFASLLGGLYSSVVFVASLVKPVRTSVDSRPVVATTFQLLKSAQFQRALGVVLLSGLVSVAFLAARHELGDAQWIDSPLVGEIEARPREVQIARDSLREDRITCLSAISCLGISWLLLTRTNTSASPAVPRLFFQVAFLVAGTVLAIKWHADISETILCRGG